jgi:nitrogen regulatory protein P-II 1
MKKSKQLFENQNLIKEALHKIEVNFFTYGIFGGWAEHSTKIYFHCRFIGKTIDTILEAASTEWWGWKIFVSDIQETYRIRTKEKERMPSNNQPQ